MEGTPTLGWEEELERWLASFLGRLRRASSPSMKVAR